MLPIQVGLSTDYIAGVFFEFHHDAEVHPLVIEAPEGQSVTLKELIVLNNPFEFELVDGRIGDHLLPLDGPLDLAFFSKRPGFAFGTYTPEEPLTLYIRTHGHPAMPLWINFHIVGTVEDWVAPELTPERRRRVEELTFVEFKHWVQQAHDNHIVQHELLRPVEIFLRDHDNVDALKKCSAARLLEAHAQGNDVSISTPGEWHSGSNANTQGGSITLKDGDIPASSSPKSPPLVHHTAVAAGLRSPGAEAFRRQKASFGNVLGETLKDLTDKLTDKKS